MNRDYGNAHYTTRAVDADGWSGLELHRTQGGRDERIAKIIFWDASGQFFVETFGTDVALTLVEELIAEAKATILTK